MLLTKLVQTFGTLLCLSTSGIGHPSSLSSHLPILPNDIHCPKGSHPTFVHNSYSYNAPLHKFTEITRSFFNVKWFGGFSPNITTGTDNVPGATRWGSYPDVKFNDTLTMYLTRPDALEYTYQGMAGWFENVRFSGYVETLRFESICGGKATYIDILAYVCSPDQMAAYNFWYTAQMSTFESLATAIGSTILAGDCPEGAYLVHHS